MVCDFCLTNYSVNMILIDAIYINDGGGKVLLDYLISELEKTDKTVFYLLDERIINEGYKIKQMNTIKFMRAGFLRRWGFYWQNRHLFSTILCFANIPPNTKVSAKVYTYFHQPLFLSLPKHLFWGERALYSLKSAIVKCLKSNTGYWLAQSEYIATQLSNKFEIEEHFIKVLPFYKTLPKPKTKIKRETNTYLYVSNATPHKNHIVLINAFCMFFNKHKLGQLILTVSEMYPQVFELIERKKKEGYPIFNYGFISQIELSSLYKKYEYLVFPSLAESFGLPIVEAIESGCKVIASDLPYVYAICQPSITFDPHSRDSILSAFERSLSSKVGVSVAKVGNNISEILNLLQ